MKTAAFIATLLMIITLSSCGFHTRSINDVPPKLRTIYVDSPNPYSPLTVQLERQLRSVGVHITDTAKAAPVTLRILKSRWSTNIPTILYSGNATSYSYTLSVRFEVVTRGGLRLMDPQNLTITRSLIQNANQVYTPDATQLMKREITQNMAILIYNNLTSLSTRKALRKKGAHHHHATALQTTTQSSRSK